MFYVGALYMSSEIHGLPLRAALKYVLIVTLAWLFDAMDLVLLVVLVRSMAHPSQLNFDIQSIGSLLISVAFLTSGIGGMLLGYLADRYGRKRILSFAILLYGLPTLLVGFTRSWIEVLILRFIAGFGVGGAWAAGVTLVAELIDPSERGRAIGIVQCGYPIGFLMAVSLSYLVAYTPGEVMFGNWRLAFIAGAVPSIILSGVVSLFVPESKIWKLKLFDKDRKGLREALANKMYLKGFSVGLLLDFIGMFGYWVYWSWLPSYLEHAYNVGYISSLRNFLWLAVTQISALLGYITYGFIQDILGRRPALTIFTTLEGISILASIKLIMDMLAGNLNMPLFIITGICVGYFMGYWAAFGAVLSEIFPTSVRTTLSGFIFNTGRSINFITPIISAYLAGTYGIALALSLSTIANFALAGLIWLIPETKGKVITF